MSIYERSEALLGKENIDKLKNKTVMVFGLGGVGGYVVEALARTNIGCLILIDNDTVSESNINRQIIALKSTIGTLKTECFKNRIKDINDKINVLSYNTFVLPETINEIDFTNVDYIVDCIDTISGKLAIIEKAKSLNINIISSMGTGNKLDPSKFLITDISKTSVCPLAKTIRYELRKKNITNVKVLYSTEEPIKTSESFISSVAFVPSVAGLLIAREVILDLIK